MELHLPPLRDHYTSSQARRWKLGLGLGATKVLALPIIIAIVTSRSASMSASVPRKVISKHCPHRLTRRGFPQLDRGTFTFGQPLSESTPPSNIKNDCLVNQIAGGSPPSFNFTNLTAKCHSIYPNAFLTVPRRQVDDCTSIQGFGTIIMPTSSVWKT